MKDFFDPKKPALWITAGLAAASLVPAVMILKKPRRYLIRLFDRDLRVDDRIYCAPFYSFAQCPDKAPLFRLTARQHLLVKGDILSDQPGSKWQDLGAMTLFDLNSLNFDSLFYTGLETEIARMRRRNYKAWQLDVPGQPHAAFYYLLQQRNGDILLAYGHHTGENEEDGQSASIIRWLFRLLPLEPEAAP